MEDKAGNVLDLILEKIKEAIVQGDYTGAEALSIAYQRIKAVNNG